MTTTPHSLITGTLQDWRRRSTGTLSAVLAAAFATLLVACGGGGSPGTAGNSGGVGSCGADCGAALITLQDAAADFQSYTVDVVSLKLRKASGAVVETLPATARVDFAQLVSLAELISAGQIPSGDYVAATVTLDYGNASIAADDGTGGSVALTPVDTNGNALTGRIELDVHLDNRSHLIITRARTSRLAFDFNLAVSNVVDLASATVQVAPMIQASVVPPADLNIRVRGSLVATDTAAASYTVDVHPFHLNNGDLGQVTVHTTDTTSYEIDGVAYRGAIGLAQLATLPAGSVTAAFGTLQTSDHTFSAERVLAGSSVASNLSDRVHGEVMARSGNTLTVRGATLERRDGSFEYLRGVVTVTIADTTRVTEAGQTGNFGSGAISVGQRIAATGTVRLTTPPVRPRSMRAVAACASKSHRCGACSRARSLIRWCLTCRLSVAVIPRPLISPAPVPARRAMPTRRLTQSTVARCLYPACRSERPPVCSALWCHSAPPPTVIFARSAS